MKNNTSRVFGARSRCNYLGRRTWLSCYALLISLPIMAHGSAFAGGAFDQTITLEVAPNTLLAEALVRWGVETGVQVVMSDESVAMAKTKGVHGKQPARDALAALMHDSGLSYTVKGSTVHIVPAHLTDLVESQPTSSSDAPKKIRVGDGGMQIASRRNEVEEVVVTAQKREETLQEVPISISVLSGDALDASTGQGVIDELSRVPGIVIPPPSAFGVTQITIRGVGAQGVQWAGSSPSAYYLDTVPFGFARSAYIPDSGAFDLARVEVLRGPQGTLYGANAENGVVSVITHEADPRGFDLKARALLSGTDSGGASKGGDLAVNVPLIPGQLAVRGVVSYRNSSGWIDRPTEKDANDALLRDYRLKVAYRATDSLSIDLSMWSSRDHFGAPSISLLDRTAPISGTTAEPGDNDFDAYGAKISYQFSHFSIESRTSYLDFRSYNAQNLTPFGVGTFFDGLVLANWLNSRVFSEEILLNSTDTGPWRWTGGAFYRDESDGNAQAAMYGMIPPTPDPADIGYVSFRDTSRSYALFGQIARRFLNDKLEWTLGLRQFHDDVSTLKLDPTPPPFHLARSYTATTPRAVLSWYPNTNMTVYSSFSEGFRSGLPQYYLTTVLDPNIDAAAKPDKLYNYELGAKVDLFEHHLFIDTSVYYMNWRDVQQSISEALPGGGFLNGVLNGASASGPGVDIAMTSRPFDRLQIGATFSWSGLKIDSPLFSGGDLVFSKGDRLNNSSEYTGSLFATYRFPLASGVSGELSASANYTSAQSTHGPGSITHGDSLLFARASFTVDFRENWAVKLYGDNLTNEYGALYGPLVGFGPEAAELVPRSRPRTVGLSVDYRFK